MATVRTCCRCKEEKELDLFYKNKFKPLGRTYECKECFSNIRKEKHLSNPELNRQRCRQYYKKNKEVYYKNRELRAHHQAKYRASKINATPDWLSDNQLKLIESFYYAAKDAQDLFGVLYHVDHIVPLQGKNVCGLHVPWNLRVIPAKDNISKGNRMPEEGLEPSQP